MLRATTRSSLLAGMLAIAAPGLAQQNAAAGAPQIPCPVSTDAEYAFSPLTAVRLGGGAAYVAARQRRYLEALRGPEGQQVTFKRSGSVQGALHGRPVDRWEVSWAELPTPIALYLDAYLYGAPKAPVGLTCTTFSLGTPPIDPFLAMDLQAQVAIEHGAGADGDVTPIPLDADGTTTHGVAFDRFRRIARTARAASAAGTPLDPADGAALQALSGLTIVAYPTMCGERPASPVAILVVSAQSGPVPQRKLPVSGDELSKLLPGVTVPDGSIAVVTPLQNFRPNDHVRIVYDPNVCEGAGRSVMLPMTFMPAKGMVMPQPARPDGIAPPEEPLWLQVVVDLDGSQRNAQYLGGPETLTGRAVETLRGWRAEPARINGSPVVADTLVVFAFR